MASGERPELRLGLVLYGGVSLAVYIYGVVVEVQRLLRASAAHEGKASREDVSAGYLSALCKAGVSRATVDIIAGTSAGGINGILLARALATGADVNDVKDLWLDSGDIGLLMHRLDDDAPASLIRSDFFETRLRHGFESLSGDGPTPRDDPLDLFVSATHLRGTLREFPDSLSGEVPTLTHRRVFQLKRRPRYGRDDFRLLAGEDGAGLPGSEPEALERLVRLARATSAFPVAFEPVGIDEGDHLLEPPDEPRGWYADGGILNNKPFTEALRTIFTRSSDRPVRRWLLSVDPDPEAVVRPAPPGPIPGFDEVLIGAASGIPRYQSVAADLDGLRDHNAVVRRQAELLLLVEEELVQLPPGQAGVLAASYERMRLEALADLIVDSLLERFAASDAEHDPEVARARLVEAARAAIRDRGGPGASDLALERRRIYYLIKLVGLATGGSRRSDDDVPPEDGGAALPDARTGLWALFERTSAALWDAFEAPRQEPEGEEGQRSWIVVARDRIEAALDELDETSGAIAAAARSEIEGVVVDLPGQLDGGGGEVFAVNLAAVFDAFELRDVVLLAVDAGGGSPYLDVVNHAQISPVTATMTGVAPKMKLAGDTLGHFGGFLDRDWRQNDLLWGRLDGAEIVLRALMAESELDGDAREAVIEGVIGEILKDECPDAPPVSGDGWRAYLEERAMGEVTLASIDPNRRTGLAYRAGVTLRRMLRTTLRDAERERPNETRTAVVRGVEKLVDRASGILALPRLLVRPCLRRRAKETERD